MLFNGGGSNLPRNGFSKATIFKGTGIAVDIPNQKIIDGLDSVGMFAC